MLAQMLAATGGVTPGTHIGAFPLMDSGARPRYERRAETREPLQARWNQLKVVFPMCPMHSLAYFITRDSFLRRCLGKPSLARMCPACP